MNDVNPKQHQGAMVATEGLGTQSIQTTGSTAESVLAAAAKARIESRLIVAMKNRRNWERVKYSLLETCNESWFSREKTMENGGGALYKLPIGRGVQGLSVDFAEECYRQMGNIDIDPQILWDDNEKRIIQVNVLDLETNNGSQASVVIPKIVERKKLRVIEVKGKKVPEAYRATRINSNGETVYIVDIDEATLVRKQNAETSKAKRNCILDLVPAHVKNACLERIQATMSGKPRQGNGPSGHTQAAMSRLDKTIIAYSKIGVSCLDLKDFLGHLLSKATDIELDYLDKLYEQITSDQTTWQKEINQVRAERGDPPAEPDDVVREEPQEPSPEPGQPPSPSPSPEPEKPAADEQPPDQVKPVGRAATKERVDEVLAQAKRVFGPDYMMRLGLMCRNAKPEGFALQNMSSGQANWILDDLSVRPDFQEEKG